MAPGIAARPTPPPDCVPIGTPRADAAIVLDGHAVSVPIVEERIAGGRVMISLGGRSALPEAQAMAAALGAGRLSCSAWTLERQDVFGAGELGE